MKKSRYPVNKLISLLQAEKQRVDTSINHITSRPYEALHDDVYRELSTQF